MDWLFNQPPTDFHMWIAFPTLKTGELSYERIEIVHEPGALPTPLLDVLVPIPLEDHSRPCWLGCKPTNFAKL